MKRAAGGLLWACAALVVVLLGGGLWLTQTAHGRAVVAEQVQGALTESIAGSVRVDRITAIGSDGVSVRGLTFEAPDGEEVLHIDEARLSPDLAALAEGKVAVDHADVKGGKLTIRERDDGKVPLVLAFESPDGSKSKDTQGESGGDGPQIALHGLRTEGLTVVIDLADLDAMRVTDVAALVRIDLSPAGDLDLRFSQTNGTLHNHPLGDSAGLSDAEGRVRGGAKHILELSAKVDLQDERFALGIDYFDRKQKPVKIRARNVSASWVGAKMEAVAAASALVSTVDLEVNPGDEG